MDPILISFGPFEIRWYSVFILIASFTVLYFVQNEAHKFGLSKMFIFNLFFWTLIFGIIGARLYYVLFKLEDYIQDPIKIVQVWNGGLAIHGGLIFGLITIVLYCKKYKVRLIRIMDFIAVPLLLGQAIGRWGNFFNQEAYGAATSVEQLKNLFIPDFIINGMTIEGVVHTPTFLYESVVCFLAFIILLFIRRKKFVKVGTLTSLYLIIYGVLRFFIEISRTDALTIGGFKMAQIASVIMIIVGIGMLIFIAKRGKFEDRYNDSENSAIITN